MLRLNRPGGRRLLVENQRFREIVHIWYGYAHIRLFRTHSLVYGLIPIIRSLLKMNILIRIQIRCRCRRLKSPKIWAELGPERVRQNVRAPLECVPERHPGTLL